MKLHTIDTGFFKLDGGAMFGVVPKSIWNKINPSDSNNLCTWAMRCLLVEEGNRLILIDTGMGTKQDSKFFSYYKPSGDDTLEKSLNKSGFTFDDVTDVFLTHLHFDHCGAAIKKDEDGKLSTQFKNATYYIHSKHWDWAVHPNARERASFLKENILPIQESGQLKLLDKPEEIIPGFSFITVNGHTESMMLPVIKYKGHTIVYTADLIPSAGHIPLSWIMAYDTRPLVTLDEKKKFLDEAVANNYILFYEHDKSIEASKLLATERGYKMGDELWLKEI